MNGFRHAVSLGLLACLGSALGQAATNPLEELHKALRLPVGDPASADDLAFRRANLEKRVKALGAAELGAALRQDGWRDRDPDDAVAALDRAVRDILIERFAALLRQALQKGAVVDKRVAIAQIAELGPQVPARNGGRSGLAREFSADLLAAMKDMDAGVRAAAARALGKLNPPLKEASAALAEALAAEDAGLRQAAADGLLAFLSSMRDQVKRGSQYWDVTPAEMAEVAAVLVPIAGKGTNDKDLQVRRTCLETIRLAAVLLEEMVVELAHAEQEQLEALLTPGRKLNAAQRADVAREIELIKSERALLLPIARALAAQVPALIRNLGTEDTGVVLATCTAAEALPPAQRRLQRKAAQLVLFDDKKPAKAPEDPFGPELPKLVPALAALAAHKEVRVRLAALYALEELEGGAAPAMDVLVKALQDGDPFVRWAAARVMGKMAPAQSDKAVPALAKALADENGDVRATAAAALERYRSAAKEAVPALAKAVASGEPEMRVLAIRALGAVGTEAKPAVPDLAKALTAAEPEVRLEAVRALGKLGPTARPARDALLKLLDDPDVEVRRTAAEALLATK
jgi:HEAT repeat protein